jgi:hypothetical protein
MACLTTSIGATEVEDIALGIVNWHKELAPAGDATCVFRDSAFADDVAKTNMAAILNQKAEYYNLESHDGIAALEAGVHYYIRNTTTSVSSSDCKDSAR